MRFFPSVIILICVIFSGSAFAKTDRSASVTIINQTGGKIVAAYAHKYSNVFKDSGATNEIKPLGTTPFDFMQNVGKARFRTGFGTTGKDWWIVGYIDNKGCKYISSPRNARKFIDGLEKASIFTGGILVEVGIDVAIVGLLDPEPVGKVAGGIVGLVTAGLGATMVGLSNTESTAGYKQHILKAKDKNITIFITKNNKVVFSSKSGKSSSRMVKTGQCIAKRK